MYQQFGGHDTLTDFVRAHASSRGMSDGAFSNAIATEIKSIVVTGSRNESAATMADAVEWVCYQRVY